MLSNEQIVYGWNENYPIGQAVNVIKDDGSIFVTKTRSEAWVLSGHTPVIMVDGITGCYLLERISAIPNL